MVAGALLPVAAVAVAWFSSKPATPLELLELLGLMQGRLARKFANTMAQHVGENLMRHVDIRLTSTGSKHRQLQFGHGRAV